VVLVQWYGGLVVLQQVQRLATVVVLICSICCVADVCCMALVPAVRML
jgi:hypothetical protein